MNADKLINSSITNTPTLSKKLNIPNKIDKIAFNEGKYKRTDISESSNKIKRNLFNTNFSNMSINEKTEIDSLMSNENSNSQQTNALSLIFNIENL